MEQRKRVPGVGVHLFPTILVAVLGAGSAFAYDSAVTVLDQRTLSRYSTVTGDGLLIHLPKGRFEVRETLQLGSKTTLEGEGKETLLYPAPAFRSERLVTNREMSPAASDITVRRLDIRYALPYPTGDSPGVLRFERVAGLKLQDLTMEVDSPLYAIDLAAEVRDAVVSECSITNRGSGGGIMVRNRSRDRGRITSRVTVSRNRVTSSTADEPIAVFGWLGAVQEIVVADNVVTASGASFGISVFGMDQQGQTGTAERITVARNSINGGNVGGIAVKGGAHHVEVKGNRIVAPKMDGIFIHSGGAGLPVVYDVSVGGNSISQAGRHCIFASGSSLRIADNTLSDCRECGVYVGGGSIVKSNRILRAHPGILLDTDQRVELDANSLEKARINDLGKGTTVQTNNRVR